MNKTVCDLIITKQTQLNYNNFLLELKCPEIIENIKPGQFINVHVGIQNKEHFHCLKPLSRTYLITRKAKRACDLDEKREVRETS